jgi:2-polyprenyl-3-methyl-5-hydroxy-6-metoxy-1,4-benzoquinol methylase
MNYTDYEVAKKWGQEKFGLFNKTDDKYYSAELKMALRGRDFSKLNMLEIGYGNGVFLGWCKSKAISVSGVELNPVLVERGRQHGFDVHENIESTFARKFDVIVAFDVLEHIKRDDLVGFLKNLHSICNSNATLIFRFPNGDNPFAYYLQNGDVTHQTAIGSAMVAQIAELSGFDTQEVRCSATPVMGVGFLRASKVIIGGIIRSSLGFLIEFSLMGGRKINWSSSIVAVLKSK